MKPLPANIDWTKPLRQLSKETGLHAATLSRRHRALFGHRKVGSGRPSKMDRRRTGWDWSKSDTQLAKEKRLSRQRVHQIRARLERDTGGSL